MCIESTGRFENELMTEEIHYREFMIGWLNRRRRSKDCRKIVDRMVAVSEPEIFENEHSFKNSKVIHLLQLQEARSNAL